MSYPPARFSKAQEVDSQLTRRRHDMNAQMLQAIDLDSLEKLLERLHVLGLSQHQVTAFMAFARALDALVRTEINRIHNY